MEWLASTKSTLYEDIWIHFGEQSLVAWVYLSIANLQTDFPKIEADPPFLVAVNYNEILSFQVESVNYHFKAEIEPKRDLSDKLEISGKTELTVKFKDGGTLIRVHTAT